MVFPNLPERAQRHRPIAAITDGEVRRQVSAGRATIALTSLRACPSRPQAQPELSAASATATSLPSATEALDVVADGAATPTSPSMPLFITPWLREANAQAFRPNAGGCTVTRYPLIVSFAPFELPEEVNRDMTMSGIWTQSDQGWSLSSPEGFADEATLHDLIEKTPEMLPLSGAPTLVILGREVLLGSGYADLLGVETSGRPVIVEIKLAYNNEARRAVVAQILAYAANLHGMSRQQLEDRVRNQLRQRDHATLADAVRLELTRRTWRCRGAGAPAQPQLVRKAHLRLQASLGGWPAFRGWS